MVGDGLDEVEQARQLLGMTVSDLWLDYFALGGMYTVLEVDAALHGALITNNNDRDLLAAALNERFAAAGGDHPLPYSGDELADR